MELEIKNNKVIVQNALNDGEFSNIRHIFYGYDIPWSYNDGIVNTEDMSDFQFVHLVFDHSKAGYGPIWDSIVPILEKLTPSNVVRIKANLRPRTGDIEASGFHCDVWMPGALTAIYYLDTNNGYTEFKDGDKIASVENQLVVFPSNLPHLGTSCTDQNRRVIINFNFFPTTGLLNATEINPSVNPITDPLLSDTDKEYHRHWAKPMKGLL